MRFLGRATTATIARLMLATLACKSSGPTPEPAPTAVPDVALDSVLAGEALLYVFNASGATLTKNNYKVTADRHRIADLPRNTYSVVAMKPGVHKLESVYRKIDVTLVEGQRAFVVVAYRPERSWASPLAGSAFVFTTVSEARGKLMISRFARIGGPEP